MSGTILPNTTRASATVPYFQPYGTGGGGSNNPNPQFSTIVVQWNATFQGDTSAQVIGALNIGVSSISLGVGASEVNVTEQFLNFKQAQSAPAIDTQLYFVQPGLTGKSANGITFDDPSVAVGNYLGLQVDDTKGFLQIKNRNTSALQPMGIDSSLTYTTNILSTPSLLVSSINNALYPPAPAIVRLPATGGSAGANGQTYTLPVSSTIVPMTAVFNVTVGHLYRISVNLYDATNNDTTATKTVIAVLDAGATAVEYPIWASENSLLSATSARGFCGISTVFVALASSYSVGGYNTSTTDTSSIEITLTGTSTAPGFILEDLGVAPP